MTPTPLSAALADLRWQRLRVVLRNRRNVFARQHPHFILRGVLYSARSLEGRELPGLEFHWRPRAGWFGDRLKKGTPYAVDLLFPKAGAAQVAACGANLRTHLEDPKNNFEIVEISGPEERSLALLAEEGAGQLDLASDEVCLEFVTPLRFTPADARRPWLLTGPERGRLFVKRFGATPELAETIGALPWPALTPLPCYWRFYPTEEAAWTRARSHKGEAILGCRGPLYLRGPWQEFLPLFQLAAELQLECGDEARRGQGACRLTTGDDRDQRIEVRGRGIEVRDQRSEVRERDAEGRDQRPEDRGHGTELRDRSSEVRSVTRINSAKELGVYAKSYELATRVFAVSKRFPAEERYALTSQIRRSSRSICLNLRGAWAKRRDPVHFVSKLSDCDGENSETDTCLDFARDCAYISADEHQALTALCSEIGRMLGSMIKRPEPFLTD